MDDKLPNPSSYAQALIVNEPSDNETKDEAARPRNEPSPKPDSWLPS
jgi:hypothetical protein